MQLVQIRASDEQELDCLMRELVAYSPKRSRLCVLIELEEDSQTLLVALLSAVEACIERNDIRSVRLELDGDDYTLVAQ